jgi:hypothetical protein
VRRLRPTPVSGPHLACRSALDVDERRNPQGVIGNGSGDEHSARLLAEIASPSSGHDICIRTRLKVARLGMIILACVFVRLQAGALPLAGLSTAMAQAAATALHSDGREWIEVLVVGSAARVPLRTG